MGNILGSKFFTWSAPEAMPTAKILSNLPHFHEMHPNGFEYRRVRVSELARAFNPRRNLGHCTQGNLHLGSAKSEKMCKLIASSTNLSNLSPVLGSFLRHM